MYNDLKGYGYKLVYRRHSNDAKSIKKGNVDTDIVHYLTRFAFEAKDDERAVLVSGDGDYWLTVDFLLRKNKFARLLAPVKNNTSYLYLKNMSNKYIEFLDSPNTKQKLLYKNLK